MVNTTQRGPQPKGVRVIKLPALTPYRTPDTMNLINKLLALSLAGLLLFSLSACTPEIGSERWCENMKAKPKGDWSTNEAVDYAKHCVLK